MAALAHARARNAAAASLISYLWSGQADSTTRSNRRRMLMPNSASSSGRAKRRRRARAFFNSLTLGYLPQCISIVNHTQQPMPYNTQKPMPGSHRHCRHTTPHSHHSTHNTAYSRGCLFTFRIKENQLAMPAVLEPLADSRLLCLLSN